MFVRLLILLFVVLFVRRVWRAIKSQTNRANSSRSGAQGGRGRPSAGGKPANGITNDITEQEIDDADFEEIP